MKNKILILVPLLFATLFFQNCSDISYSEAERLSKAENASSQDINQNQSQGIISQDIADEGPPKLDCDSSNDCQSSVSPKWNSEFIKRSNPGCTMDIGMPNTRTYDLAGKNKKISGNISGETNLSNGKDISISGNHPGKIYINNTQKFKTSGNLGDIFLKDVLSVDIHGNISKIMVDSPLAKFNSLSGNTDAVNLDVKTVSVHGNHGQLCVRANNIPRVSGNYGSPQNPTVLVGSGANPILSDLHGNNYDVYVENFAVKKISGNFDKVFLNHVDVKQIHGNVKELHLMNASNLDKVSGNIDKIFVYDSSTIGDYHGNIEVFLVGRP